MRTSPPAFLSISTWAPMKLVSTTSAPLVNRSPRRALIVRAMSLVQARRVLETFAFSSPWSKL